MNSCPVSGYRCRNARTHHATDTSNWDSTILLRPSASGLHRLEVHNWGNLPRPRGVWNPDGRGTALTGDIGSGKSTLVDAITTVLVPPAKIS